MDKKIQIFVSYSHQDAAYLEKDSLLGFLQGLERDNIEFWTDCQIKTGELWGEVIKNHIQSFATSATIRPRLYPALKPWPFAAG